MSWKAFWRRHKSIVRTTAQMVQSQEVHLTSRDAHASPTRYILKTTAFVTTALTVAGGSWYVAVNLTSASDLTAIYNCSAFFAYAFSIPLLKDKLRFDKIFSVAVAIAGVLTVAYGDSAPTKHPGHSGGAVGGKPDDGSKEGSSRTIGNIVIGIGSVLYGLYEVLYKKYACPPEGTSPGRGMIFANTFGSLIGLFTLTVLWIPLPILHFTGIETFELPRGEAAWMLLISVLANASKYPRNPQSPSQIPYPSYHSNTKSLTRPLSILWLLPRPHLPHLSRPLQRRRPAHNLHRRHRRLVADGPTALGRRHRRRRPYHRRLLPLELEHVPRDERGADEEVGGGCG